MSLEYLDEFRDFHRGWVFRGHRVASWKLETSLERAVRRLKADPIDYERQIVREFQRHAHTFSHRVPANSDTVEWLALMQHYGAPTRLLDFTTSFWIAVFFAIEDADDDCAVWAIDRGSLRAKDGRDFNAVLSKNIFERQEVDGFLYEDVPFFTNERLALQKGTFLFSLDMTRSFDELLNQNRKRRECLVVRKRDLPEIRRRLSDYNCTARVLFPGIDGYARSFKNHEPA